MRRPTDGELTWMLAGSGVAVAATTFAVRAIFEDGAVVSPWLPGVISLPYAAFAGTGLEWARRRWWNGPLPKTWASRVLALWAQFVWCGGLVASVIIFGTLWWWILRHAFGPNSH